MDESPVHRPESERKGISSMANALDKISVEFLLESKTGPRHIISLSPKDNILKAAKVLKDANVGIALVMQADKIVGIISERDIVRRWLNSKTFPKAMLVEEIMTKKVEFVTAFDNVRDCYLRFVTVGCRHLPVLDPMMQVMGVLSIRDVADYMVRELSKTSGSQTGGEAIKKLSMKTNLKKAKKSRSAKSRFIS